MPKCVQVRVQRLYFHARDLYIPTPSPYVHSYILALKNDTWQVQAPTRCGGYAGDNLPSWDVPPVVRCWGGKKERRNVCTSCMRMCMCCVCVVWSTSAARFPLCQSVAAMEHPGLAQPSIRRLLWLSAYRHTHTRSVMSSHKPPITLGSEETKATHDFIKGYSCCVRGHRAKRIFSPKIQHRQQVMLLRHFLSFSACHTLLTAIWRT